MFHFCRAHKYISFYDILNEKLMMLEISLVISTRSVPNDTSSAYPIAPASPYYIPVGPAAAGIAFAIAVIFGVALWRLSPLRRRKRSQQEPQVELAVVNCSPSDPPADAQEPLPQYRARDEGDHLPGYNEEQPHAEVGTLPPEYPRPVAV